LDTSLVNLQTCLETAGQGDRARAVYRERYASLTPDSPVEEADFTIRTYNTLKRLACHRLRDAARLSVRDLVYLPWPMRWTVTEIEERLALVGLGPLEPGQPPEDVDVPGPPYDAFGALCVRCGADDAVAQLHRAVVAAYAVDGVREVGAQSHLELFVEGQNGLDRALEVNPAEELGSDLVLIVPESGGWVGVHSARWELTPQGRHPLARRLSARWPVLSITASATVYEVCRYEDGAPVQYAAHGRPAEPAPETARLDFDRLDFDRLAGESWLPTTAAELRAAFGEPHAFGNLVGLPSTGIEDLLEGWPVYDPDEAGDSAVFLWRG
jgi:hypothetical protein